MNPVLKNLLCRYNHQVIFNLFFRERGQRYSECFLNKIFKHTECTFLDCLEVMSYDVIIKEGKRAHIVDP